MVTSFKSFLDDEFKLRSIYTTLLLTELFHILAHSKILFNIRFPIGSNHYHAVQQLWNQETTMFYIVTKSLMIGHFLLHTYYIGVGFFEYKNYFKNRNNNIKDEKDEKDEKGEKDKKDKNDKNDKEIKKEVDNFSGDDVVLSSSVTTTTTTVFMGKEKIINLQEDVTSTTAVTTTAAVTATSFVTATAESPTIISQDEIINKKESNDNPPPQVSNREESQSSTQLLALLDDPNLETDGKQHISKDHQETSNQENLNPFQQSENKTKDTEVYSSTEYIKRAKRIAELHWKDSVGTVYDIFVHAVFVLWHIKKKNDEAFRDNDRFSIEDIKFAEYLYNNTGLSSLISQQQHSQQWTSSLLKNNNNDKVTGLNSNIRIYKYNTGQRFEQHYDDSVKDFLGRKSDWTLLIYLNGGENDHEIPLLGGETVFYKSKKQEIIVKPERGMALLHKHGHDCLLH
ncbi:3975_t:CDS:2 [Diversispora eburnea]|uniref:3975_t:CDS:1 n=1 Tax=Diversispora eburnea TaxID=1213867 RepID=A0A9N8YZ38_9GLOM|nr:3975_t:CDS:2 [Diversispora eburnea]